MPSVVAGRLQDQYTCPENEAGCTFWRSRLITGVTTVLLLFFVVPGGHFIFIYRITLKVNGIALFSIRYYRSGLYVYFLLEDAGLLVGLQAQADVAGLAGKNRLFVPVYVGTAT